MADSNPNGARLNELASAERAELEAVLASPTFARAQRLVKLLVYVCEKHFAGQDGRVCEYSIATEVLGRPANFDPAEDAIARVEIHRLRKKLRDYYAAEGAHQTLKIIIPPGLYTPVFQPDTSVATTPQATGPAIQEATAELPVDAAFQPQPRLETGIVESSHKRGLWLLLTGVILLAVTGLTVLALRTSANNQPETPAKLAPVPLAPNQDGAVRIMAGADRKYIDHYGHTWLPDRYFEGGGRPAAPFRGFFARTSDPLLYQNGRIGLTGYNIPLKPGTYQMKLHFVEPVYGPGLETGGGENSRVFDILLNGKQLIDGFDIVSDAGGPLIADIRVFKDVQPGPDNILRLGFHARREQPLISAIEIEPAEPHRLNPIRIVTQANSVTDSHGQVWQADNYYAGGQTSNHFKVVNGTPDADLFANERYGHFSYAIPVAPGEYSLNLYLAESYWGKENLGGEGTSQRVFDIYCNGSALARSLDILKEAGPNRALIKRFHGLRPTMQGKLNLEFVPVHNYASVYAIEVLDEAR